MYVCMRMRVCVSVRIFCGSTNQTVESKTKKFPTDTIWIVQMRIPEIAYFQIKIDF